VYLDLGLLGIPRHYHGVGDLPIIVSHSFASLMICQSTRLRIILFGLRTANSTCGWRPMHAGGGGGGGSSWGGDARVWATMLRCVVAGADGGGGLWRLELMMEVDYGGQS
jgi:hypothetical protein